MKKKINKPMRAAGALLVATMLTTCMTAGTFAKYVTTDSATDSARVAKFGVVVNANGNLYGKEYAATTDDKPIPWSTISANTGTVQAYSSSDSSDVVAPGTKSDGGLGFNINGTPEVDVRLQLDVAVMNVYLKAGRYGVMKPLTVKSQADLDNAWTYYGTSGLYTGTHGGTYTEIATAPTFDNTVSYYKLDNDITLTNDYYPVKYSMTGGTNIFNTAVVTSDSLGASSGSVLASLKSNIETALGSIAKTSTLGTAVGSYNTYSLTVANIPANNSLDTLLNVTDQNIQWSWDYHTSDDHDKADTILGNLVSQKNSENVNTLTTDTTFTATNEVVKISGTAGTLTAVAPTEATYGTASINNTNVKTLTAAGDFCLFTEFYVGATVTQVD